MPVGSIEEVNEVRESAAEAGTLAANDRVLTQIALDILRRGEGSRLATTLDYQEELGAGSGTIQKALKQLAGSGAVSLRARGHQGTFVTRLDPGPLWQAARLGAVRVVVTPPGSVEGHGLVQGLRTEFRRLGVPVEYEFVRGGSERLDRVLDGRADIAILSAGAVQHITGSASEPVSTVDIGDHSYYGERSIVVLSRPSPAGPARRKPIRVGIDRGSYDHSLLTMTEFPEGSGFEYVNCDFPTMPAAVLEGTVDVGIWHRLSLLVPLRLLGLQMNADLRPETETVLKTLSSAQLIWLSSRAEFATLLERVDSAVVLRRQNELSVLDPDSEELRSQMWLV